MERKGCDLAMEIARAESDASQKHSQGGGSRLEDKHSKLTACLPVCLLAPCIPHLPPLLRHLDCTSRYFEHQPINPAIACFNLQAFIFC